MSDYIKRLAGPYTGAGQKTFTFGFFTFKEEDVYVGTAMSNDEVATILELGVDYTVTLNDDQDAVPGGSITLTSATGLAQGEVLVIGSALDYVKNIDLTNYSRFPPEQIDTEFLRIVIMIQQLVEKLGRALIVPETSSETPAEMIERLSRAQQDAQGAADEAEAFRDQAQAILNQVQSYGQAAVTIAPYAPYLITVANSIDDVNTVGENILTIQTVAGMEYSITTVASLGSSLGTLASNVDTFEEVAEHSQAIQIVAADFNSAVACPNVHDFGEYGVDDIPQWTPTGGSISTVADSITEVETVAGLDDAISYIYQHQGVITNAASLQPYEQYLATLAGAVTDIGTVADNIVTIQGVYALKDDLTTVSTISTDVTAVADNMSGVTTVAENKNAMLVVAADFTSSVPCPNVHDFGEYGVDDIPAWTPTGGSISTVATNINDVGLVADNTDNLAYIVAHWDEISTAIGALNGTALLKANNLSDVANPATARTNLGLGTMATSNLDLGEWSEN